MYSPHITEVPQVWGLFSFYNFHLFLYPYRFFVSPFTNVGRGQDHVFPMPRLLNRLLDMLQVPGVEVEGEGQLVPSLLHIQSHHNASCQPHHACTVKDLAFKKVRIRIQFSIESGSGFRTEYNIFEKYLAILLLF